MLVYLVAMNKILLNNNLIDLPILELNILGELNDLGLFIIPQ
ncbi:hypothetical protein [Caldivirga sp. UBA161]|nr:hypothetical protein [Caldivirga sp. UBA161]